MYNSVDRVGGPCLKPRWKLSGKVGPIIMTQNPPAFLEKSQQVTQHMETIDQMDTT